jgi:hypothetical protein
MPALKEPRTQNGASTADGYVALVAEFQAASTNMKACSAAFNAVLVGVPAALSDAERSSFIGSAAAAYENSREEFLSASSKLHAYLIKEIVASRPTIQSSAQHG